MMGITSTGIARFSFTVAGFLLGMLLTGGCATKRVPSTQPSADTGRRAEVRQLITQSTELLGEARYAEALVLVDQILAIDPENAFGKSLRPFIAVRAGGKNADDDAIEVALEQRIEPEVRYQAIPLRDALRGLGERRGIPIRIDDKSLSAADIDSSVPITLWLKRPVMRVVLDKVLGMASTPTVRLAYVIDGGELIITTAEQAANVTITRVYDVRDLTGRPGAGELIVDIPNFTDAPDFNLQANGAAARGFNNAGGGTGLFGGAGLFSGGAAAPAAPGRFATGGPIGGKPLPAPPPAPKPPPQPRPAPGIFSSGDMGKTREERVEDLVRLTQETIAPDTWRETGGSVGAIRELEGQLIVTQTREGHRQFEQLLQRLREAGQNVVAAPPQAPAVAPIPPAPEPEQYDPQTEAYDRIEDNPFLKVTDNPLSTFSIDVDTASYANVRRMLNDGQLPPPDAVRIEEFLNYFPYDYRPPAHDPQNPDAAPFSSNVEIAACPWKPEHRLVRIGLKGMEIPLDKRPASNLVFLIDVSGSMQDPNKLSLVKEGLTLLTGQLTGTDRIAMVVYAGSSGLVLPSTVADEPGRKTIIDAIEKLEAGGSTNGGEGIELAYTVATENFIKDGVNRVILCTDGDFNVGITDEGQLTRLIERKAKTGVFLTVLGFGMGNLKDSTMEKLADKGNGNYGYVDTLNEAKKMLVEQMSGTLITIAKDVKIQVEFNPAVATAYRLIGYENRMLAKEDFNDDTKDAGEIGAGHAVTALYEVVPAGVAIDLPGVDELKYKQAAKVPAEEDLTLQIEAAKADLELKQLAVKRAEQAVGAGTANDLEAAEAKLGVRLAEIKLKRLTANVPPEPSKELLTLKLRYKTPQGSISKLQEFPVTDGAKTFDQSTTDFRFAAAVAHFGMTLRGSTYRGKASLEEVAAWATAGKGDDKAGYRAEFISLLGKYKQMNDKAQGGVSLAR